MFSHSCIGSKRLIDEGTFIPIIILLPKENFTKYVELGQSILKEKSFIQLENNLFKTCITFYQQFLIYFLNK